MGQGKVEIGCGKTVVEISGTWIVGVATSQRGATGVCVGGGNVPLESTERETSFFPGYSSLHQVSIKLASTIGPLLTRHTYYH